MTKHRISINMLRIVVVLIMFAGFYAHTQAQVRLPDDTATALAWNPVRDEIADGYADGSILIWNLESGSLLQTITDHSDMILDLDWSSDGRWLLSGSFDTTIRVWDSDKNYSNTRTITEPQEYDVPVASWSPDGELIVAADAEGDPKLFVWDADSGSLLHQADSVTPTGMVWNTDGTQVAIALTSSVIEIWDISRTNLQRSPASFEAGTYPISIDWSHDGKLFAIGSRFGTIRVWDFEQHTLKWEQAANDYQGDNIRLNMIGDVFFSPDDSLVYSVSVDGTFRTWDTHTGELYEDIYLGEPIHATVLSPDGTRLAYKGRGTTLPDILTLPE